MWCVHGPLSCRWTLGAHCKRINWMITVFDFESDSLYIKETGSDIKLNVLSCMIGSPTA